MNPRLHYLLFDILYLAIPLLFSFSGKMPFFRKWKYLWISTLVTGIIFFAWNLAFTAMGVWEFNHDRLMGWSILGVPLEEALYYVCISYAGVFVYHALTHAIERDYIYFHHELISSALSVLFMVLGIYQMDKAFTGTVFIGSGIFLAFQMIVLKPRYMSRFYFATPFILLLLIPHALLITGQFSFQLLVWHDINETLGIRLGTAPIEVLIFGWLLILVNVTVYEWLKMRAADY
ncbi:MAG TPA: lycopene cyclase domain-containing protein [Cyclobacteriaceae bacterium]|nr:lycopene cyclase domain-containing protein [Cyclobacteriaceae bacterium]